ncbi:hypothetical protein [Nonomuraea sp. NPDC050643]|uniref:hypothetical protein n=1 Tax=Nonomuraea sp. NPDC050643 TaxID=3155660 RepID=UPI0033C8421F
MSGDIVIDEIIPTADKVKVFGIEATRLGDVLAWKASARRPKDLPDISAIDDLRRLWTTPRIEPVSGRPLRDRSCAAVPS